MERSDRIALAVAVGSFIAVTLAFTFSQVLLPAPEAFEYSPTAGDGYPTARFYPDCDHAPVGPRSFVPIGGAHTRVVTPPPTIETTEFTDELMVACDRESLSLETDRDYATTTVYDRDPADREDEGRRTYLWILDWDLDENRGRCGSSDGDPPSEGERPAGR